MTSKINTEERSLLSSQRGTVPLIITPVKFQKFQDSDSRTYLRKLLSETLHSENCCSLSSVLNNKNKFS